MSHILYFSDMCPDTAPFVAQLKHLNIDYQEANISTSLGNLKQFLQLSDKHEAFLTIKENGKIGIPALLLSDGRVILDFNELGN